MTVSAFRSIGNLPNKAILCMLWWVIPSTVVAENTLLREISSSSTEMSCEEVKSMESIGYRYESTPNWIIYCIHACSCDGSRHQTLAEWLQ